jgi:hypothetical protein
LIAIGVETECRSVVRSLSRQGPIGEPDAPIATESKIANLFRRLKMIRGSDSSMLAIGLETGYRTVARSLSEWSPKREHNAPIIAESDATDFLRRRHSCSCFSGRL